MATRVVPPVIMLATLSANHPVAAGAAAGAGVWAKVGMLKAQASAAAPSSGVVMERVVFRVL